MKFESRISSIRRIAWKQWRSCSADSTMPRLVGEVVARGMDPLTPLLEHRRHRMLREPVDLELGMQPAQLVGDRSVSLRVTEPDRRRDIQGSLAAGFAAHPARRPRRGETKSRSSRLTLTGSRACGKVTRAFEHDELAARQLGETCTRGAGTDRVLASVDHEHGTVDAGEKIADSASSWRRGASWVATSVSAVVSSPSRLHPRAASSSAAP